MKKSLVLAMAMALGVTASAYAANPFSDVPAGHWAYDSINKLAAAGVIEGYGDATFGGDKLMTRYEMAQIVAKAMAKGANVDKLAAEFADELDNLGVRVANLEKKADNVKISGNIRYSYADYDENGFENRLRSRIWINGQVNDDWTYTGMLENNQYFDDNAGNEDAKFQRAYVNGKIGGLKVQAGRYNHVIADGNLYDTRFDGVQASYGKDVKVTAFYGRPTNMDNGLFSDTVYLGIENLKWNEYYSIDYDTAYGAKINAKVGAVNAEVGYTEFKDGELHTDFVGMDGNSLSSPPPFGVIDCDDNKIWNVGVNFDLAKDLNLSATYLKSDLDSVDTYRGSYDLDDEGYVIGLSYRGAKADKVGSWGLYGKYYDQGRGTVIAHTMNGDYGSTGFEGYMVGVNYTFAKNIVGTVEYYDLETKAIDGIVGEEDKETLWTQLVFTF